MLLGLLLCVARGGRGRSPSTETLLWWWKMVDPLQDNTASQAPQRFGRKSDTLKVSPGQNALEEAEALVAWLGVIFGINPPPAAPARAPS